MAHRKQITEYYGHQVVALSVSRQKALERRALDFWRMRGFPFRTFSNPQLKREIDVLSKYDSHRLHCTLLKPSMVGLALANSFHPQIWSARVRGKSALDIFNDDAAFRSILARSPRLWPNRRCWNDACVRMMVGIQNRSRVSNFRPTVARCVADRLSQPGGRILDFCAGYGGRYLGVATLDRFYVGIDAAPLQVSGLTEMARRLNDNRVPNVALHFGEAEELLPRMKARSFDLVFTSPPYFRLEKYSDDGSQCWRKYDTYEDWKHIFLYPTIKHSLRLLKAHGFLALNVANINSYPIADDARYFLEECLRVRVGEWHIYMSTNPRLKRASGVNIKSEPLFVVQKRGKRV